MEIRLLFSQTVWLMTSTCLLMIVNAEVGGKAFLQKDSLVESGKNRSKIHLTIELDDNETKKGKYIDLSKGRIKNITFNELKPAEEKKINIGTDSGNKQESSEHQNIKTRKNSKIRIGHGNVGHNTKTDDGSRMRKNLGLKDKESTKRKKLRNKKPKDNKKQDSSKKTNEKKMKRKKKGKTRRKIKKKRKTEKTKMKKRKHRQRKKQIRKEKMKNIRKKLKSISNPDGGPNPKNLKIPLTFLRKEIQTGSNSSNTEQQTASNGNDAQVEQETKSNNSTDPNSLRAVKKLKNLSKQLVIATLKDLNSTEGSNARVKVRLSNPLEIKMGRFYA